MALVTITRSFGCGDSDIAHRVAKLLQVKLYDDFELKESALYMGIRSEDLKSLDEKAPGFFDRLLSRTPELYQELMEAVVYEVAQTGEGVIIGHGSQILLRDFGCALHILIHAPKSNRIQNIVREQGIGIDAAEKLILKKDNQHRGFFRYAFNLNLFDHSLYDLVINTQKMGTDTAVRLITEAAGAEEIKACSLRAMDAMERRSLEKRIRAALVENDINVNTLHVEVSELHDVSRMAVNASANIYTRLVIVILQRFCLNRQHRCSHSETDRIEL